MLALSAALLLALFSAAVAQEGRIWLAGITAALSLGLAGWVAVTIVPALARRTSLRLARLPGGLPADARGSGLPRRAFLF